MLRRTFLQGLGAALPASAAFSLTAGAWANQQGPVRLVVPYPAGGGADAIGRHTGQGLSARLGRNVIVENKAGAGGAIGTTDVARSSPGIDTLLLGTTAIVSINPVLYSNLGYQMERDFSPVVGLCEVPLVVIAPADSKHADLASLVDASRSKPGEQFFASSGNGTIAHMGVALLNHQLSAGFEHVPYAGEAAAVTAILAGDQAMAYYSTLASALPLIQAGRVRALGVPAEQRNNLLPSVPTLREQGLGDVDIAFWYGLLAPRHAGADFIAATERATLEALESAEFRERLETSGFKPMPLNREDFTLQIEADIARYGPLAKSLNLQLG